jgi:fatty-acyl-CoA synthase
MSLGRILEHHADRFADRPAVSYDGTDLSYAQLRDRVAQTAGALREAGVARSDVVAVLLHNSMDFVEVMLGAAYLGAVFMPLNWRLAAAEIDYIVAHAGTCALVCEEELLALVDPSVSTFERSRICLGGDRPGWTGLDSLRAAATPPHSPAGMSSDDLLRLMYTSGTTSRPKGVMITYGNLDAKCIAHTIGLGLTRDDRGIIPGPLYHVGALDLTFTNLFYLGAWQRILRRFDPSLLLDGIERDRATTVWLAPAMVRLTLDDPSLLSRDLSSVRTVIDGGEKMPLPLIERVLSAFPSAWFADAYGLTETVSGDTFLDKGKTREKLGSVGKPVFNVELTVVDANDRPTPANTPGEIVIRGTKVCAGYWNDPEATQHAFRNGWFHSGDIGIIDDDGYLYIVDRLKDMILTGGENVASSEVERVLHEHADVEEVAVIGVPDARWGEVPVAYVVLRSGASSTETEMVKFCDGRLARFKTPKRVRFVDALPRNPSGKVLKRELREREAAS